VSAIDATHSLSGQPMNQLPESGMPIAIEKAHLISQVGFHPG